MTTSQQSRLGDSPEEGMKAPVVTVSTGQETLFGIGQTIASVVIGDMDRVAVAAQTDSLENGIYVARGGKSWVRATDFNNGEDVINGQLVSDSNTSAVYTIIAPTPWTPGLNSVSFGLLLSPVGFFWGAITGTLSNQADLQLELDAKSDVGHTHVEADITDLQAYILDAAGSIAMDGDFHARRNAAWEVIDFSVFAPTVHTHVEADITDLQAYLTDAQGSIDNDDQLFARANGGWQAFSTASGTVGEIIAWPEDDPPQNFLTCDGSLQNATTFADLFAVLGFKYGGGGANFNLPDLRGTFIRGRAGGSGNDPDRLSRTDRGDGGVGDLVGTKQGDTIQAHVHTVGTSNVEGASGANFDRGGGSGGSQISAQSTGGNETRPLNVYMNYIIRFTGGGSGITQPPTIEVQDTGIALTTAAQVFNFEGFILTQPVTDEITIRFGASVSSAIYCPGYLFNFINTLSWSIESVDAVNLFSVGRRLRFVDGALTYHGTIVTSSFSAGDTVMTMSMEDGDVLTNTITEVCLTTNSAGWSPIAEDPFSGGRINGIATGVIAGTEYWVIVGNAGLLATSSDVGLTWTLRTSGTSENINDVAYNPDDESFLAVADAGEYTHSVDTITWTVDVAKIPALPEALAGSFDMTSVAYDKGGMGWRTMWERAPASMANAFSTDDTATWDSTPNIGTRVSIDHAKMVNYNNQFGDIGTLYPVGQDIYRFDVLPDETGTITVNTSSETNTKAILSFGQSPASSRIYGGHDDGDILNLTGIMETEVFGSSAIREMVISETHQRIIAVSDDGKIGFQDEVNYAVPSTFALVANGSNPLANFTGVKWNEADGMFIAVNDQGQILRSSNGLDNVAAPTFTGFTLIAADPFSGTRINRIMSGTIGGSVFWVAIGPSGQLYTSTDAGITWTVRATGTSENLISIAYNITNQQFFVGASGGDFLTSTDGTTWTLDNTTIAALGGLGPNDVIAVVWDTNAGLWWTTIAFNVTVARRTYSTTSAVTVFTARDTNINMSIDVFARISTTAQTIVWPELEDCEHHLGAADTTDTAYMSVSDTGFNVTAIGFGPGNGGFTHNFVAGKTDGGVVRVGSTTSAGTVRVSKEFIFSGRVNGFAYSSASARWCGVDENFEIWTLANGDFDINGAWVETINPFTAAIRDIWYDPTDDIFIAVGQTGEIGRSTDGISA